MKSVKFIKSLLALIILSAVIAVIWFFQGRGPSTKDIQRILLISIDTCRADYLGCYGYQWPITPNIDRIAKESTIFTNAITPVPITLPAHSSMLTGTIPPYHGAHDNIDFKLGKSNLTLSEILSQEGFATAAVVSAFVLDSQFGLDQGFNYYNDLFEDGRETVFGTERRGEEANRFAIEWLEEHRDERWFMFLHYYDPHTPYEPPEPFATQFADNLYAGEIAYTDYCIGQVIKKLKELKLYDSTLIIITADHGEMLGEHGELDHAYFIYQSAIKVPLIFKLPGQTKGRKIDDLVGLIDIVPTICKMLDIKVPPQVQGKDLSAYFGPKQPAATERYLYSESLTPTRYKANSILGVVTERFKYIQTTRPELYDLIEDPGEAKNLVEDQPQRARILQDRLKQILEKNTRKGSADSKIELDEQSLKRLQSLGYVGSATIQNVDFDQSKDDPKDLIDLHNSFHKVIRLMFEEKYDQAKAICQQLLPRRPEFYETWFLMATITIRQNDLVGAAPYLYKMLELKPDKYRTNYTLGLALTKMGKLEEATKYYTKALEIDPKSSEAHNDLGSTLYQQGKLQQAIEHYTKALQIDPNSPKAHENLAKILAQQGQSEEAIDYFNKALQLAPAQVGTHYELAAVLLKLDRTEEAIEQLNEFIDAQPENTQLLNKVGALLALWDKPDEAIVYFKKALELEPEMTQAHHSLAQVYLQQSRPDEAVNQYKKLLQIQPENFSIHNQLASLFHKQKDFEQAAVHLSESLQLKPDQPAMLNNLAKIYSYQGKSEQSLNCWNRALQLQPDWPEVLNSIAWLKATDEDESLRYPEEAIELALRACELTDFQKPELLDTLAVAYAAAGDFQKAVETAEKATQLAGSLENKNIADEIKKHLELFKAGKAYQQIKTSENIAIP